MILIRRRNMRCPIWVCIVLPMPHKSSMGVYEFGACFVMPYLVSFLVFSDLDKEEREPVALADVL